MNLMIYLLTSFISGLASTLEFKKNDASFKYLRILFLIYLIIIIGFRFEVGGDWDGYQRLYYRILENFNFNTILFLRDPLFILLNYFSQFLLLDYFGVNIFNHLCFSSIHF